MNEEAALAVWQRLLPDDDPSPMLAALDACLEGLDADQRDLIHARYVMNLGSDALAKHCASTVSGVESRLYRIRQRLHACITQRMDQDDHHE